MIGGEPPITIPTVLQTAVVCNLSKKCTCKETIVCLFNYETNIIKHSKTSLKYAVLYFWVGILLVCRLQWPLVVNCLNSTFTATANSCTWESAITNNYYCITIYFACLYTHVCLPVPTASLGTTSPSLNLWTLPYLRYVCMYVCIDRYMHLLGWKVCKGEGAWFSVIAPFMKGGLGGSPPGIFF